MLEVAQTSLQIKLKTRANYLILFIFFLISDSQHKVQCSDDLMKVDIVLSDDNVRRNPSDVYLEGMKGYPNTKCQPTIKDNIAQFQLSLLDFYECGVTRIVNTRNVSLKYKKKCLSHFSTAIKFIFAEGDSFSLSS